jgi:hypothetical protein
MKISEPKSKGKLIVKKILKINIKGFQNCLRQFGSGYVILQSAKEIRVLHLAVNREDKGYI